MLWLLIRSTSSSRFYWVPITYILGRNKKTLVLFSWKTFLTQCCAYLKLPLGSDFNKYPQLTLSCRWKKMNNLDAPYLELWINWSFHLRSTNYYFLLCKKNGSWKPVCAPLLSGQDAQCDKRIYKGNNGDSDELFGCAGCCWSLWFVLWKLFERSVQKEPSSENKH